MPLGEGAGYIAGMLDIDERHRDRWRQGLLAAIGAALDAKIELAERLHQLTRLLIEHRLAGLATVLLVGEGGELARLSVAALDPADEAVVRTLPAETRPARTVVSSGRSMLIPELTAETMMEIFRDPAQVEQRMRLSTCSAVLVPLTAGGTVLGVLTAMRGPDVPRYSTEDQSLLEEIGRRAGVALDNARLLADERASARRLALLRAATAELSAAAVPQQIAQILQRSLLPTTLPELAQLAVAARYLPGAQGADAGGDWYDALPLAGTRAAISVGDVVGQGAPAAAVMGQLRSALTGYLLAGHPPAVALEYLDRFATRVNGATACSACCLVIDHASGELRWASAGHLPPLVLDGTGTRYLDGVTGAPLSVGRPGRFTEGHLQLAPGASVLLYTDGLVERRGEVIDDGLGRLAATVQDLPDLGPDALAEELIQRMLDEAGPADDVVLVALRLIPAPLHQRLPARLEQLTAIRRTVRHWADAAGLGVDLVDDLQLAVGEATANAVEHAYPADGSGELVIDVAREDTGAIRVAVQDFGAWRDAPPDNHYRGRGLDLISSLATDVRLIPSPTGTQIHFRIPPPLIEHVIRPPRPGPPLPRITIEKDGDQRRLAIHGDLDLPSVTALRTELFSQLSAGVPVVLDLRPTGYLASAGVGLLNELAEAAERAGVELRVLTDTHGPVHRIFALTGLDDALRR